MITTVITIEITVYNIFDFVSTIFQNLFICLGNYYSYFFFCYFYSHETLVAMLLNSQSDLDWVKRHHE